MHEGLRKVKEEITLFYSRSRLGIISLIIQIYFECFISRHRFTKDQILDPIKKIFI